VHGARNQLFAGAAFALHENGAAGGGDGADDLLEALDSGAVADDVVERVAAGGIAAKSEVLTAKSKIFQSAVDGDADFFHQSRAFVDV
jgi:hypothetical protein